MNSNQYVKHYSTDWAKVKARTMLYDMIQHSLLKEKRPEQLRVLCFPGIDAAEVIEVYDRLGIPRQNVIGIEREKSIAMEIKERCPKLQVIPTTLEEYIETEKKIAFDVISLDYLGALDKKQMDVLEAIRVKQERDIFVFHSNNLARRDQQALQFYSAGYALDAAIRGTPLDGAYTPSFMKETTEKFREIFLSKGAEFVHRKEADETTQEEKVNSYAMMVKYGFMGRTQDMSDRAFRFCMGRAYDEMRDAVNVRMEELFQEHKITERNPWNTAMITSLPGEVLEHKLMVWCKNNGIMKEMKDLFAHAILNASIGHYFLPMECKGYSYISESGSPMIGQVMLVKYPRKFAQANRRLAELTGYPHGFMKADRVRIAKELQRMQPLYLDPAANFALRLSEGSTEFLGNASKPVLTKQRFLEALDKGHEIETIKAQFRGWTNKPLAQWKAHHTMGTYIAAEHDNDTPLVSPEDADIERIEKEEAIQFLLSGMPPEEIQNTYPTSFSLGQLRAFKAHITMGTYQEKPEETQA